MADVDLRREMTAELRAEAERRGMAWDDLLDAAGLPKASRSRLNRGLAGLPTISAVRAVLDSPSNDGPSTAPMRRRQRAVVRDLEIAAMEAIICLDDDTRRRVISWAVARFAKELP